MMLSRAICVHTAVLTTAYLFPISFVNYGTSARNRIAFAADRMNVADENEGGRIL